MSNTGDLMDQLIHEKDKVQQLLSEAWNSSEKMSRLTAEMKLLRQETEMLREHNVHLRSIVRGYTTSLWYRLGALLHVVRTGS